MGTLASTTFQCGFIEEPEVVPGVIMTPNSITAHNGLLNSIVDVKIFDGGIQHKADGLGPISTTAAGVQNTETGVTWNYYNVGKVYGYRLYGSLKKDVLYNSYVTYKGVNYPFALQLTRVNDGESIQGEPGRMGAATPPYMLWEEYGSTYEFQDGDKAVDGTIAERRDAVLYGTDGNGKYIPWLCIRSHVKAADKKPQTGSEYWKAGSGTYDLFASRVVLAENAFIGLFSGNQVRIYNSARQIVGVMSSIEKAPIYKNHTLPFFIGGLLSDAGAFSKQPRFAVDEVGRTYHGGVTGQHIEIDPISKVMNIFNSAGEVCATHSGREISVSDVTQVSASGGTYTKSVALEQFYTTADKAKKTFNIIATDSNGMIGAGKITVNIPAISMQGKQGTVAGQPIYMIIGRIDLMVTLNGATRTYSIGELRIGDIVSNDVSLTTAATSITENFNKGDEVSISLVYTSTVKTADGYFRVLKPSANVTTNFSASIYRCEFGANGFFLAQNTQNYIYVLFVNGVLHVKAVSNGTKIFGNDN